MYWNQIFVRFILLVNLKCNIDQIHGLNWVLANKVKNFKIYYTVICFYDKFVKRISLQGVYQCALVQKPPKKFTHKKYG
jgi:hypothetical protein